MKLAYFYCKIFNYTNKAKVLEFHARGNFPYQYDVHLVIPVFKTHTYDFSE